MTDAGDLRLFESSLRAAVERGSLEDALLAVGWHDAIATDPAFASVVFAVQGELNLTSAAVDDVVVASLGLTPSPSTAVVLPAIGSHRPPARDGVIDGLGTSRLIDAQRVVVVTRRDGRYLVGTVEPSGLADREIGGIDPKGNWLEATGTYDSLADEHEVDWDEAVSVGQRAIATELAAASRVMLALARDHAVERIQFGRPIASFQAVRHKLADCLLAIESAQVAVDVAWAEPSPFASAMAKAIAGRTSRTVAKHSQQVLAGMGFTSEHSFHHYLKRVMFLDQLFGSSKAISEGTGAAVLSDRKLPDILPL